MRTRVLVVAVTALAAATASAQTAPRQFTVGASAGWTRFGSATGIEDGPFAGVDGSYRLPIMKAGTDFGIGFTFAASNPKTRGDQFPAVLFDFGDTSFIYKVPQRFVMLQYGLQATIGQQVGPLRVYANGGGGLYSVFLSGRQTLGNRSFSKGMGLLGGGVEYAANRTIGVRLELRDAVLLGYNRDQFDASVAYSRNTRILDALPKPDPTKRTINNMQAAVIFSYVPNRRGGGGGESGQ